MAEVRIPEGDNLSYLTRVDLSFECLTSFKNLGKQARPGTYLIIQDPSLEGKKLVKFRFNNVPVNNLRRILRFSARK